MAKKHKKWYVLLLAVYSFLMLWLLFGQRWGQNAGTKRRGLESEAF